MARRIIATLSCAIILICTSATHGVLYEVGAGKPYASIQAAVTQAAADTDVGTSADNTPSGDPVEIRVYAGTYSEAVSIPADPAGAFNGLNDGWTIRANTGDKVVIDGSFTMGVDRDHCTFEGFDVNIAGHSSAGFYFGTTARSNWIKDTIIYGNGGGAAVAGTNLYGWNKMDHVTIYGTAVGVSYGYASGTTASSTIIAGTVGDAHVSSDGSGYDYSDLYGASTNANDNGNNVNWDVGLDPLFTSTNPGDADFLYLATNSPCVGTGTGASNMGARPTGGSAATVGACCSTDALSCWDTSSSGCATIGGVYHGDGTNCAGVTCTPVVGACCAPDGSCAESQLEDDCLAAGGVWGGDSSTCGSITCDQTLFEVGGGKEFATIQAAVNAAALLDDGGATNNNPRPDPVQIVVFAGTYAESVSIPTDGSGAFNGANDGWSIRANTGDKVLVQGGFSVSTNRDHLTFEGIDVEVTGSSSGFYFGNTARSCTIKDLLIYGNGGGAAIAGSDMYGFNFHDHVTIYGTANGVSYGYQSSANVTNCITANVGSTGHSSSSNSPHSYSDVYGCDPNFGGGESDAGNNLNWPDGLDPTFASTNPADPDFLHLVSISPTAGTGSSAGTRTSGQFNMGALPTVADRIGACCSSDGLDCQDTSNPGCDNLGYIYEGDGTDCGTWTCVPVVGACCTPDGTCAESQLEGDCLAADGVWGGDSSTCGSITCDQTLFEVGPGKEFATIQAAVDAADDLDDGGATNNNPRPDPVEIRVYAGTYSELVSIPADPANVLNGANDGWLVRANLGDKVVVEGFSVGTDRDNCTFQGFDVDMSGHASAGFYFGTTARSNWIKDTIIYGGGGGAAVAGANLYGWNRMDHVTIYGTSYGVSVGYASSVVADNTIIANTAGDAHYSSDGSTYSYSNIWGTTTNANDGGNNVNWPGGADPLFSSTNPADADFLNLVSISPSAGTGSSAGTRTGGAFNMGALPTDADGIGACCSTDGLDCQDTSNPGCDNLGYIYEGDGTDCGTWTCVPVVGACCTPDGTCAESQLEGDCLAADGVWGGDSSTCGSITCDQTLFEVGGGKEFATIQAAVNAAALLDDGGATNNNPRPDPVQIVVFAGTYTENVSIPADPAGAYNGANDHWTIRANPGDKVVVQGGFSMGTNRDWCTFQGLDVAVTTSSSGFYFGNTARSNWIKDTIIYGAGGGGAAVAGSSLYGSNKLDHVTIYGTNVGISYGYASGTQVYNSIIANALADEHYSSDGSLYEYSDLWGTHTGGALDGGNNLNWDPSGVNNGVDPLFASTNPADPDFLHLVSISPAAGTGSSAGTRTSGQFNMGALPTVADRIGACCSSDGLDCQDTSNPGCDNLGYLYEGDGTDCGTWTCVPVIGACCTPDGICTDSQLEPDCLAAEGQWSAGMLCTSITCDQTLFEVGADKEYAKIQDAVDAAALLDDPGATNNTPRPDPVQIVVYEGIYEESVAISGDSSGAFDGANDGWTLRTAACNNVLVRGNISVATNRDHVTFDGINLDMSPSTSSGFSFSNTARSCWIKNLVIFGDNGVGAAIAGDSLYGWNKMDHVTIYGTQYGISYGYASGTTVENCIIANTVNAAHFSSDGSPYSYSDLWGTHTNASDAGNNLSWPVGEDPQFLSTDPTSKDFLRLSLTSPARNAGSSAGRCTDGESNMGALGSGPIPTEFLGACCIDSTTCADTTIVGCYASGGTWLGTGSTCASADCSVGACCAADTSCAETTEGACTGDFRGWGSTCATVDCVPLPGDPVFDRDYDGDVDQDDFGPFQACFSGDGNPYPLGCQDLDRPEPGWPDGDGDVDNNDYQAFEACASGPDVPADPTCDD